jgi:hypothetical protein
MNRLLKMITNLVSAVDVNDLRNNLDKNRKRVGNIAHEGYRQSRRRVKETKRAFRPSHGNSTATQVVSFITGLGFGLGMGLLFAPAKGERSRAQLADMARRARRPSHSRPDNIHENLEPEEAGVNETFVGGMSRKAIEVQKAQEASRPAEPEAI